MTTTTPDVTPDDPAAAITVVDAFLGAICAGTGIPAELYAPDARLDATVPNWRLSRRGPVAISEEYSRWFAHRGELQELDRTPIDGGEVVRYLLTWSEAGVPHAAHHCHRLTVGTDGRIAVDTVFCGGRWSAELLAEMAEADQ